MPDFLDNKRAHNLGSLRLKLERDPATPRVILTDPGLGYRLGSDEQ